MKYQTYTPHPDLQTIVKCYWTLEVPDEGAHQKQLILPDGCVDICFILGDDIKRYISESEYIIQPRNMLLGQIKEQFYIEPTGYVNTFAIRFYPLGFVNFIEHPFINLANKETPLSEIFGASAADDLSQCIVKAHSTDQRIEIIERFLFKRLNNKHTINSIVKSTIDSMLASGGSKALNIILKNDLTKRRQLERNFSRQIGMSPKQLSKVIRLQATLQMLLEYPVGSLTQIAYENDFYDQAHFIKDFKEFTGLTPGEFLNDETMALSSEFYKKS